MGACNLGCQAIPAGHTALFVTAGNMGGDLAALDSNSALHQRLRYYAAPDLLLIDEVGHLSYATATPTCCSNSSAAATSATAP